MSKIVVLGKLRDKKGRVLYLQLSRTGEWGLPGGKIETGETPREALVREIKEELGVDVLVDRVIGVREKLGDDQTYWTYIVYEVTKNSDTEVVNLEPSKILQIEWREEK